jgi:hypothetical protein
MNRADLQALANLHLRHGEALLNAQLFAGAYYISGYAVECGLKAAVAKLFRYTADFEFPGSEKRGAGRGGLDLRSHDLPFLVKVAGLSLDWADELDADGVLKENWNIAKDWTPDSRYQLTRSAREAQDYYSAVADMNHGVLKCIGKFW